MGICNLNHVFFILPNIFFKLKKVVGNLIVYDPVFPWNSELGLINYNCGQHLPNISYHKLFSINCCRLVEALSLSIPTTLAWYLLDLWNLSWANLRRDCMRAPYNRWPQSEENHPCMDMKRYVACRHTYVHYVACSLLVCNTSNLWVLSTAYFIMHNMPHCSVFKVRPVTILPYLLLRFPSSLWWNGLSSSLFHMISIFFSNCFRTGQYCH